MSDKNIARQLFDRLKAIGPEVGAEVSRLGRQGSSELASALWAGHAFVPYGPGQYVTSVSPEQQHQANVERQPEQGIER